MRIIEGKNWNGPWERPRRSLALYVPKNIENVGVWLPEKVKMNKIGMKNLWYEKMRKYWIPTWPEAKLDEAKKSRKTGMRAEQGPSRYGWIPKRTKYAGDRNEP
ncbi:hypothetical protein GCK32_013967, partial [Trichostrongylus colubriformis]